MMAKYLFLIVLLTIFNIPNIAQSFYTDNPAAIGVNTISHGMGDRCGGSSHRISIGFNLTNITTSAKPWQLTSVMIFADAYTTSGTVLGSVYQGGVMTTIGSIIHCNSDFYQSFLVGCDNPPYYINYRVDLIFRKADGTSQTKSIGLGTKWFKLITDGNGAYPDCSVSGSNLLISWNRAHLATGYNIELRRGGSWGSCELVATASVPQGTFNTTIPIPAVAGTYEPRLTAVRDGAIYGWMYDIPMSFSYTPPSQPIVISGSINASLNEQPTKPIHSISASFNCTSGHTINSYSWVVKSRILGGAWQTVYTGSSSSVAATSMTVMKAKNMKFL
jgi:hypothetical protein